MTNPPRLVVPVLLAVLLVAACGTPGPTVTPSGATGVVDPAPVVTPTPPQPTPSPAATAAPTATPTPTPIPTPSPTISPTAATTPTASQRQTIAPSPGENTPTSDTFWSHVAEGIRAAGRLEVGIDGPGDSVLVLRFESDASATVIDGVVGSVCIDRRTYDGQSGFTTLPGRWTCGAAALLAGYRHLGQPIDAWNATVPSDSARAESVTLRGTTWTWRYRATSAYLGGEVTTSLTLDGETGRITAARRVDPTGVTRYTFRYGADFPPLAVPR